MSRSVGTLLGQNMAEPIKTRLQMYGCLLVTMTLPLGARWTECTNRKG